MLERRSEISTGDLSAEVTAGRSQNHRSTDGLQERNKAKRSGNGCLKRGAPLVPKLCRRQLEKCGVGKPHEGRVVGKWKRNVQKEREHERISTSVRKG